ncbi:hypothetical protein FRC00_002455 [Tulasnella sp. 408]|nr:hypothetical protein FRC00_002455 [Tulasnella sp. 408]
MANVAVDAIPLAIDKCWSNFRAEVTREPPSTDVMQILEGLVELGYIVHQLSEDSPFLSSHALPITKEAGDNTLAIKE